jgi:hypothetical protein
MDDRFLWKTWMNLFSQVWDIVLQTFVSMSLKVYDGKMTVLSR